MEHVCLYPYLKKREKIFILECLWPSKFFAGSCYTYSGGIRTTVWEHAYNNCLSLIPLAKDARLLVIDSVAEYEFVVRDLIGPKFGAESVSVYVGLRKINGKSYNEVKDLFFI